MVSALRNEAQAEREAEAATKKERIKQERREAKRAAKQARRKTDPELLAFSRELRDRWQEHVTAQPHLLEDQSQARYDVSRLLAPPTTSPTPDHESFADLSVTRLLDAA